MASQSQLFRSQILEAKGATDTEIEELLLYNQNFFEQDYWRSPRQFPLPSEPHLKAWSEYLNLSAKIGVWETLKNVFIQLQFPIVEGISKTQSYREATLKGIKPNTREDSGIVLQQPDKIGLKIYSSLAGEIPVLLPANRADFVTLVQAITKHNEPIPIPNSMGACMVGGYNNWERIHQHRRKWSQENPHNCHETAWKEEFGIITRQKNLYQDRFIILSDGFYSNVSHQKMGLTESTWRELSLTIRLEHECTHYLTRRLLNSMSNNLLDELIADYRGIVAAIGYYRADWFLRFMGLESFPHVHPEGRIHNYQGETILSNGAFSILQALVKAAAENIEYFDRQNRSELLVTENKSLILIALTHLTMEELASESAFEQLQTIFQQLQTKPSILQTQLTGIRS